MSFDVSKEDWKRELRNKSPIYAAYDENKSKCEIRKKVDDDDTDNDSGLQSIDGDTIQDRTLCNIQLDCDLFLSRQDSGVSSENFETTSSSSSSSFLISNKDQQVLKDVLATKNKSLSRSHEDKQVGLNGVPANYQCEYSNGHHLRKKISQDTIQLKNAKYLHGSLKDDTSGGKLTRDEKHWKSLNEENGLVRNVLFDGKQHSGSCEVIERRESKGGKGHGDKSPSSSISAYSCNKEQRIRRLTTDENNNTNDSRYVEKDNGKTRFGNQIQSSSRKSQNLTLRNDLWKSYKTTAEKLTEIVDQLLYKDLMCVHLTEEILNFSNINFTIEDEMLEDEETFLVEQIFNSTSLLQTLETISEHQQIELKISLEEHRRTEAEIKERQLRLQYMQRAFRNQKFKHAPKQLKRYCSVESLLSDADHNELDRKKPIDVIWDENEEYTEEISLV